MHEDLGNYRKIYQKEELLESGVPENPMELFRHWFYEIESSGSIDEPNAMNVATNGLDGFPKNRMAAVAAW